MILDHRIVFLQTIHPMLDIAAESVLGAWALAILDRELHDTGIPLDLGIGSKIKRLDPWDEAFDPADAWLGTHPCHKDWRVAEKIHQNLLALIIKIVASDN